MQQSRLIKLLSTLSSAEMRRFEEFLRSPYFNKSDKIIRLFEQIRPYYPDFQDQALKAARLGKTLLGLGADQLQPFHDLSSQMTRLLEQFLVQEQLKNDERESTYLLCESLLVSSRQWYFDKIWSRATKANPSDQAQLEDGLMKFRYWELGLRQAQMEKRRLGEGVLDQRLSQTHDHLDQFFLSRKLQLSCENLNRSRIINTSYVPDLLEEISVFLNKQTDKTEKDPMILLYASVFRLLKDDTDEAFDMLLGRLSQFEQKLDKATGLALYSYAQNYCIRQINRGRSEFLQRLFELYQRLLDNRLILEEDGQVAHWNYKNITTVALRLKNFQWVTSFLEEYKHYLEEDLRESVYHYNLAAAKYEQKHYNEALRLLQQTNFTDIYYDLSARSMILKIYYELEEEDGLFYAIQAFDVFLRRNKSISKDHQIIYKNLLRYIKKINRLRSKIVSIPEREQVKRVGKLQADLKAEESVANQSWLLAKLGELGRSG